MTGFIYSADTIVGKSAFFPGTTVRVKGRITPLGVPDVINYINGLKETDKASERLTKLNNVLKPGVQLVRTDDGNVYACKGFKEIP